MNFAPVAPVADSARPARPASGRRSWPVAGYLVAGAVAVAVYAGLPRGVAAQVVFVAVAASVPLCGLVAGRFGRGRSGWTILLAGFALAAVGEVVDLVSWMSARPLARATIDVVFLVAYVVQLCGLMTLFRAQVVSRHQYGWFDAVAVALVVGVVVWSSFYEAIFGRSRATPLDWVTRFGGAVLGMALLVTALRLVLSTRGTHRSFNLLLGAFGVQLFGDSVAALWHGYVAGGRVDTVWLVGFVLAGAALATGDDGAPAPVAPTKQTTVEIRHTMVIQTSVTALLAVLVLAEAGAAVPVSTLVVWGVAWAAILLLGRVRVLGLLRTVGEASDTENQRRLVAMIAGSGDVRGLADADGTIRFLTPSVERLTGVPLDEWIGRRFDQMLMHHLVGLEDLAVRLAGLRPGEAERWECSARSTAGGDDRTVELTIANHVETPGVDGWVIGVYDVTDAARLASELRHQSLHDTLTGLPNRALLCDRIQRALDRMGRRPDDRLAVVLVDLDDFKAINDSLGYASGDDVLRAVAQRMVETVRPADTVARLGGDEFALLFEDLDAAEAMALARRVLENLALPIAADARHLALGASAGVVCAGASSDPDSLLRSADIAMYASKRGGGADVTLFADSMHESAQAQLDLRLDLAVALERGEFRVLYQPIVDTRRQCVAGAEALIRWHHPERGVVSPVAFIPVAEQSGHIRAIGAWVLRTACTEAAGWSGPASTAYISVNVSAAQLTGDGFVELVFSVLDDTGLAPSRLLLEITESMVVGDATGAASILARLRERGVRIAIDDFGTGYSSLAYLSSLCADVVKIDRSFVHEMSSHGEHRALTRTILTLADGLQMSSIAEGVEHVEDYAALVQLGCPYVQGFLFSRPVAADALAELFAVLDVASLARPDGSLTAS